jgi:hypothetical protein
MAVKLKILYTGDLPSGTLGTATPLDSAAGTKGWLIKNIYFYNGGGSPITLDLYVTQAGGLDTYLYKTYSVLVKAELLVDHEIALNHNTGVADKITARCVNSGSQTLSCVISGIERDQ